MTVVRVDLRQPAVRARLRELAPPASSDPFPFSDSSALTDLPVRLLLIVPLDDIAATDAEELALKLLGSDPSPRTLVALVSGGGRGAESSLAPASTSTSVASPAPRSLAYTRTLPAALGRHPEVRFLDLRAEMLSFGHPRTGLTRLTGDDGHGWPDAFVRDLVAHLMQVEIFDAVWAMVPPDRPATVGMRVAALGEGRERAVADLALRLSAELDPGADPYMGSKLPKRWEIDRRLLPAEPPYPQPAAALGTPPAAVRGLAGVATDGPFRLLARRLEAYNEGVPAVIAELEDRPRELARLLRESERRRDGAPGIDPIGAAALDSALGGIVFGDDLPRLAQEGEDPAARIGDLLEIAAERQAEGVSVALLADWLRDDAARVDPEGPAAGADRLVDGSRPWSRLASTLHRRARPSHASAWVVSTLWGSRLARTPRPAATEPVPPPSAAPEPPASPPDPRLQPSWEVPPGLHWYVGARAWRSPWRWLTLLLAVLLLGAVIAQLWANFTGTYLFTVVDPLVLGVPLREYQTAGMLLVVAFALYLVFGFAVALALRRWGSRLRFAEVPELATRIGAEAQAVAIAEVARFGVRREYARMSRAAADTLEHGSQGGSDVARGFGERLGREFPAPTGVAGGLLPPHRELVAVAEPSLAGTDAGGIYRVYPLYVTALRAMFGAALVRTVRERWPRIRGVFWQETEGSIIAATSAILERRLAEILEFGLRRGELTEDGVDPADDLAERLWANAAIRERALRSLHLDPADPMPLLATPADTRLLDQGVEGDLIVAIPHTLEPLIRPSAETEGVQVITSSVLETAAAIRIFAFQPGIYDFAEPIERPSKPLAS